MQTNKEDMKMRKALVVLSLVAMLAAACLAANVPLPIILAADDNYNSGANSASAFHLNTTTGAMTFLKQLKTGGTGLGGGYFSNLGTAITSNGHCVFVTNTDSDTISWFEGSSFTLGGSAGIPGMFSTYGEGGSIAVSPNGKLLASGDSGLLEVSTWSIAANCALTHIADYTPTIGGDYFSPLGFTPNGEALVVPAPDYEGAEIFAVNSNGTLTDVNNVTWSSLANCANGCYPSGLDFTNDSKVVVFGSASLGQNAILTASIGPHGLGDPQVWLIPNGAGVTNPNVPWFSQDGAKGHGELYVSFSGYSFSNPAGEVTLDFVENPLSITVEGNGNGIPAPGGFLGALRTYGAIGNGLGGGEMVIVVYPNMLQPAKIDAGGAITLQNTTTDPNAVGLLSISIYPATR
jgi:hypothetical protein